jgi:hypothetical protein
MNERGWDGEEGTAWEIVEYWGQGEEEYERSGVKIVLPGYVGRWEKDYLCSC